MSCRDIIHLPLSSIVFHQLSQRQLQFSRKCVNRSLNDGEFFPLLYEKRQSPEAATLNYLLPSLLVVFPHEINASTVLPPTGFHIYTYPHPTHILQFSMCVRESKMR